MSTEEQNIYGDMILLPHPEPKNHTRMSMHDRAAQFSAFAALSGHKEILRDTEAEKEKSMEEETDLFTE